MTPLISLFEFDDFYPGLKGTGARSPDGGRSVINNSSRLVCDFEECDCEAEAEAVPSGRLSARDGLFFLAGAALTCLLVLLAALYAPLPGV